MFFSKTMRKKTTNPKISCLFYCNFNIILFTLLSSPTPAPPYKKALNEIKYKLLQLAM